METLSVSKYRMPVDRRSVPRKQIETSFLWLKNDGYYAALDLMSRINSMILFNLSYDDLYQVNFPYLSKTRAKNYLKMRRLPDTEGTELVDENSSCYSNIESVVFVRSLGKDTWKKGNYNRVTINNLAREDDSFERRTDSIMNIKISCPCVRSSFERSCRASSFQRDIFKDGRGYNHIPGSFVDSVLCKHTLVALDWLSTFQFAANFGTFGIYAERIIEASNQSAEYILDNSYKLPKWRDYDLNQKLNKRQIRDGLSYLSYWTEPLRKFIFPRNY